MSPRELLRRELRIVFGARVTWFVLAASALLVGHSFVLAIDLFSAASRSALGFGLMRREMDPLAGIVRPMLGGLYLAASLLVPVIAARGLAIERERRSYGALALAAGSTLWVVAAKGMAALLASLALTLPVAACAGLFVALGGHLDGLETAVALSGHVLHLTAVTAIALAAAAGSATVAQATTAAVGMSLASWAIDAGEGFAALSWLGSLEWASVSKQLEPFEHGIIALGPVLWFVILAFTAAAMAVALSRIASQRTRWLPALAFLCVGVSLLSVSSGLQRGYDCSEQQRASLPPGAVAALRKLRAPIRLVVFLDADDGRRAQLEGDTLAKLRLARPDLIVETPLDRQERPSEGARNDSYGRILVSVGNASRETRSTSRRELTTLIFEAAGTKLPDWSQPTYAGYPTLIERGHRTLATLVAYGLVPGAVLLLGWFTTRIRRRFP